MTRKCLWMRGSRSTSASTPPPSWGLRRWPTWRRRSPRGRPPPRPPSRLRGCWTVGRLLITFCTASSSLRRLPDRLYSVGTKLIVSVWVLFFSPQIVWKDPVWGPRPLRLMSRKLRLLKPRPMFPPARLSYKNRPQAREQSSRYFCSLSFSSGNFLSGRPGWCLRVFRQTE